ncbi:MAG: MMPL family transporter, partial [Eudoraea sp.]|nr:MMPL family transporter [Eudoraea sp.]
MLRIFAYKKYIIVFFALLTIGSLYLLGNLRFSFDFSQFFPEADDDLTFYQEFMKDFGADDNFLLIAVEKDSSIFDRDFLSRVHQFTLGSRALNNVKSAQSLTTLSYPLKTTFGYIKLPVIHLNEPEKYESDWAKIQKSELYLNSLIAEDARSMVIVLITKDELNYDESVALLQATATLLENNGLKRSHIIGRASFYQAIVDMEKREFILTSLVAFLLITLVLFLVYRDLRIVLITLLSVIVGIMLFMGLLSLNGKDLNLLALFYPLLLVIVGTSDVIHIMDAYLRELKHGRTKQIALRTTLKGVGLSTLLTSLTTAAGFASLLFSKLRFIKDFGLFSALGVMIMYFTV